MPEDTKINIWHDASNRFEKWGNSFKESLIKSDRVSLSNLFEKELFGQHNGLSIDEYLDYEIEQFKLNVNKTKLVNSFNPKVYSFNDTLVYVIIDDVNSPIYFENFYRFNSETGKMRGNNSPFKVETKFNYDLLSDAPVIRTGFNLYKNHKFEIKKIIVKSWLDKNLEEQILINEFDDFLNISVPTTSIDGEILELKIFTNKGIIKTDIVTKGLGFPGVYYDSSNFNKDFNFEEFTKLKIKISSCFIDGKSMPYEVYIDYINKTNRIEQVVGFTDKYSNDWLIRGNTFESK